MLELYDLAPWSRPGFIGRTSISWQGPWGWYLPEGVALSAVHGAKAKSSEYQGSGVTSSQEGLMEWPPQSRQEMDTGQTSRMTLDLSIRVGAERSHPQQGMESERCPPWSQVGSGVLCEKRVVLFCTRESTREHSHTWCAIPCLSKFGPRFAWLVGCHAQVQFVCPAWARLVEHVHDAHQHDR